MVYTYDYDSSYSAGPALPVVEFQLKAIGSDEGVLVSALIDSGADATILSIDYLEQARVEQVGRARMRWGPHVSGKYDVYLATIQIGPHTLFGVRVLADEQDGEAILGRDVLNQMKVILNGPAQVVEIPVE